jgi:hypothetical protein
MYQQAPAPCSLAALLGRLWSGDLCYHTQRGQKPIWGIHLADKDIGAGGQRFLPHFWPSAEHDHMQARTDLFQLGKELTVWHALEPPVEKDQVRAIRLD